ncbi:MAG TPA: HDOD domain-containing protein, partial [Rhodocyclaceae bacterium]|nr:HDOD domain-containing protein [Rhodocyclaceae bacterium]
SRLRVHAASATDAAAELARLAEHWPDARDVFVGFTDAAALDSLSYWQPPLNVMLEIPAACLAAEAATVTALIADLVGRQIPLCLDDYAPGMALPARPNFRFLLADAQRHPDIGNAPASVLAKGLTDGEDFAAAVAHGYAGAVGWFFLQPPSTPSRQLNPNHARIIDLLNLVRNNAEVSEIELALKKDVTLAFKLLRYINSAGFGMAAEVNSFRHAVTIMGYDKLNRWLSLLLVNASQDHSAPALMQTAVIRGRYMELLGAHLLPKNELDNLFIAGAFSVLDILLGTRMEVVFERLQLPAGITAALLQGDGAIAPLLQLARTCETGSASALQAQLTALGLSAQQSNSALIEALSFADKLQFG